MLLKKSLAAVNLISAILIISNLVFEFFPIIINICLSVIVISIFIFNFFRIDRCLNNFIVKGNLQQREMTNLNFCQIMDFQKSSLIVFVYCSQNQIFC